MANPLLARPSGNLSEPTVLFCTSFFEVPFFRNHLGGQTLISGVLDRVESDSGIVGSLTRIATYSSMAGQPFTHPVQQMALITPFLPIPV